MSGTNPLKKIGFVYLVRGASEGNVYIPVKKKVMRIRDFFLAIILEIDRFFLIYFYVFIVPNNVLIIIFLSKILTAIAEVRRRIERIN